MAFILSGIVALFAAFVAFLSGRLPRAAALLGALGRLVLFSWMPWPVVVSAFLLVIVLLSDTVNAPFPISGDNSSTLFLGALIMAPLPALLAAQDAVRLGAGSRRRSLPARLVGGLLQLAQALLLQMAGFLSVLTIVELVFARPGLLLQEAVIGELDEQELGQRVGELIEILAVLHAHRDPTHWKQRT